MKGKERWLAISVAVSILTLGTFSCNLEDDSDEDATGEKVAVLFVGHGEPAAKEDGDVPITLADGTPFGPHAVTLGVPEEYQYTEWAAAYEEIATAMTYIFPDLNENDIPHELEISPDGDVPPFFTWEAFHESVYEHYDACNNYSPHNNTITEHINNLDIQAHGVEADIFVAYLDAVPRIPDVVWEITNAKEHQKLVVIPLLLASSTHTQEVDNFIHETAHMTAGMDVVVSEPYFEVPYMKKRIKESVIAMADYIKQTVPKNIEDEKIGVLLASHGTPYVPPFSEFGWHEDEIFSNLILTENIFHEEIAEELLWKSLTGRMNYSDPTIEDSLSQFEDDGFTHVIVVPSAFPTAAIHTMWDVADAAVGRAVLPEEGVIEHTMESGMKVYYTAEGYADMEPGQSEFRKGLAFMAEIAIMEILEE